jgi:hypothetical protein
MRQINAIDTLWGMVCVCSALAMPSAVFIYATFIRALPRELDEAAALDGCSPFSTFWRVIFPVIKPATASFVILNGFGIWNNYAQAVFFLQSRAKQNIPQALSVFFQQFAGAKWHLMAATAVIAIIPVVIVFSGVPEAVHQGIVRWCAEGLTNWSKEVIKWTLSGKRAVSARRRYFTLKFNTDGAAERFRISVFRLDQSVLAFEVERTGPRTTFTLPAQRDDFCGLGVLCEAGDGESASCAVDIQGEIRAFRYGFLSDFSRAETNEADVLAMAKHHVNTVQFYDWSYRHDTLVADFDDYTDMMGKPNSFEVIRRKIVACHQRGMCAVGYGAVYAASEPLPRGIDWRLYARAGEPIRFIDVFAIMNLESGWREHIVSQYCAAVQAGFDGIHLDTYGFPKDRAGCGGEHSASGRRL